MIACSDNQLCPGNPAHECRKKPIRISTGRNMKQMSLKKILSLQVIIGLVLFMLPVQVSADLGQLYKTRLSQNLAFQQALLKLEEARVKLGLYDENFIPSVLIGTSTTAGTGMSMTNGEIDPYTVTAQVLFEKLFGTSVLVSLPYKWDTDEGHRIDSPSLTVSRRLFDESGIAGLRSQADLLSAEYQLEAAQIRVLKDVVSEICSQYYNAAASRIYAEYGALIEESISLTKNETDRIALKKKLYAIQKLALKASYIKEISWLTGAENPDIASLYREVEAAASGWEKIVSGNKTVTGNRSDIDALELMSEAAVKEADFSILPFLPNPVVFARIAWNTDESRIDWTIGFNFIVQLIDHGERKLAQTKREQGSYLAELELADKKTEAANSVRNIRYQIDMLQLDLGISSLDLEEAARKYAEYKQMYDNMMVSSNAYKLVQLDYELAGIANADLKSSYYKLILDLFSVQGISVRELIE